MKKTIVIVLILLAAAGGYWYQLQSKKAGREKAFATKTVNVEKGTIEDTVEATGEVTPMNRVEIKPPIAGRIETLLVDEGTEVKRGQILAWMSSSDRAAILDAARAKGPAEVKKWEDSYKPTPIVAPLSGIIILRNVVVGQTVDATTVLYAMSDQLIVLAQVDEADIGRVKNGLPARIVLDAYPDQTIPGAVSQILNEGKNVSNVITYGVKVIPKGAPAFFRSQMTANVSLVLNRREDVLLLPSDAVRQGSDGNPFVMTPGQNGEKPVTVPVKTGLQNGAQIEIVEGLNAGDPVLISRARYTPQKGPQTSPLTFNGPKPAGQNQPRGGSGNGSGGGQRQQR